MDYYVKIRGKIYGPYTTDVTRSMIEQGRIGRSSPISTTGTDWGFASDFEEFFPKRNMESSNSPDSISNSESGDPMLARLSASREWFISNDGQTGTGPYSQREIYQGYRSGNYRKNSLIWREGGNPVFLEDSVEFTPMFINSTPAVSTSVSSTDPFATPSLDPLFPSSNPLTGNPTSNDNTSNTNDSQLTLNQLIQIESESVSWVFVAGLALSFCALLYPILFICILVGFGGEPEPGTPSPVASSISAETLPKYTANEEASRGETNNDDEDPFTNEVTSDMDTAGNAIPEVTTETNTSETETTENEPASPGNEELFDTPADPVTRAAEPSQPVKTKADGLSFRPCILIGLFLSLILYIFFIYIVVRHWQYYVAIGRQTNERSSAFMLLCRRRMTTLWNVWGMFSIGFLVSGGILVLLYVICLVF